MRPRRFGGIAALVFSLIGAKGRAADASPVWAREVAPILYRHCVECHRPGGVAPFSLLGFSDAAKRAKFIADVTQDRIMPPWLPSGPENVFQHERALSVAELATLTAWAKAWAPSGDLSAAPAEPPAPAGGWRLGPPDVIVRMPRAFHVPAGPGDVYRAFPIALPIEASPAEVRERALVPGTDVLGVSAVEIHPGNRRVLHHAHVWVDTSGVARRLEAASGGVGYEAFGNPGFSTAGYLGGHVPGTTPQFLPSGIAETYRLGGDLVLQVHYSPTGKPETDQTEIGIYFVREPVKRTVEWLRLGSFNLEIPAGAATHTITDELEIPADCFVLSVSPHMHLLGRTVMATATLPDGSQTELLTIPHWDFGWQDRYSYKKPLLLPRGTRVRVRWIFDNSSTNPRNPHSPPRPVHFGPNTTDEMCEFHLYVVPVDIKDYGAFSELMAVKRREKIAELTAEQRTRYGFELSSAASAPAPKP
jgi:mono/diheme cytochrome c family protein